MPIHNNASCLLSFVVKPLSAAVAASKRNAWLCYINSYACIFVPVDLLLYNIAGTAGLELARAAHDPDPSDPRYIVCGFLNNHQALAGGPPQAIH